MEILNIRIYSKNKSLIEMYPCHEGCFGFDIEPYQRFLAWAIENADSTGKVLLHDSAYDTIIELTQWDDLPCPSSDRTPENCTSIRWTFYANMPSVQVNTCSLALKC